jgi:hypothetical protein
MRAAVAMLAALLTLDAMGRLEWAVYASFGAFAAVYGGPQRFPGRARLQAAVGALLTASVTTGALVGLTPSRQWLVVPAAAAWAVVAALISDRFGWRPPGPMFATFAVAAAATVPSTAGTVAAAAVVAAATAATAVLLGAIESAALGSAHARPDPPFPPAPRARQLVHAARCGVAVVVAGVAATASGSGHPYWAMVAAVVPVAVPTWSAQVLRGLHRATGTLLGVGVAAGLLQPHLPPVALIVVVAVLQGLTELVVARNYGLALVFITPLALLLVRLAVREPTGELVLDRAMETLIGVAVGLLAAFATRRRPGEIADAPGRLLP